MTETNPALNPSAVVRPPKTERRRRLITPLDRNVASEFLRIFVVTLLGFPLLVSLIDLVDNLRKYTERKVPLVNVAWSYYYMLPDTMFMVLPAATLFATVFSIGAFTRYSEITAAKASGISFYRFIAPIIAMSFVAMGLGLIVGEEAPPSNAKRLQLLKGQVSTTENERFNFAFASATGRVYRVYALNVTNRDMERVEVEQRRSDKQPGGAHLGRSRGLEGNARLGAVQGVHARHAQRLNRSRGGIRFVVRSGFARNGPGAPRQ